MGAIFSIGDSSHVPVSDASVLDAGGILEANYQIGEVCPFLGSLPLL